MLDILSGLESWLNSNDTVALATVVQTWGSSPRGLGAKMAMTPDGKITGSVSGGCVEGHVFEVGTQVLSTGQPQLLHYGVADETAWEVGLACGGKIDVFVKPLDWQSFQAIQKVVEAHQPLAIVTVIRASANLLGRELVYTGHGSLRSSLPPALEELALEHARRALENEQPERTTVLPSDGTEIEFFVDTIVPPPTLIVVGGVHTSIALAHLAKTLGYRTVLVDPRRAFGNATRFPHVDQLLQVWPQEAFEQVKLDRNTCVAMLTHDPKIDDPALMAVLNSPAFYVGALGSQTTQGKRRQRLAEAGLSPEQIQRIHGPIGLDLGGKTPEETALAIMAEIVAVRRGKKL